MRKRDYYEVLGIDRAASDKEIKRSFRSLARRHHPDKNPDDPEAESRFKEVQEAYAVLSNPDQRRRFDMFGHDQPGGGPFGSGGFEGFNISFEDLFGSGFESLFSQVFGGGGGRGRRRTRRGEDMLVGKRVPFQAAFDGTEEDVEIDILVRCEECSGVGASSVDGIRSCSTCDGAGRIARTSRVGPFVQETVSDCPTCQGVGRTIHDPCTACFGEGRSEQRRRIRFSVPRGAEDGMRLRLHSQGAAPPAGGGNLYIELQIDDHPWFERNGGELLMALPLGFPDFALGTKVEIEHVDGAPLVIDVPAGSRPGDTVIIPDRGMHHVRGSGRGEVTVLLKLHVPDAFDDATRRQVEAMRSTLSIPQGEVEASILSEAEERRSER